MGLFAWSLAWIMGMACQLQQARLWPATVYLGLALGALTLMGWASMGRTLKPLVLRNQSARPGGVAPKRIKRNLLHSAMLGLSIALLGFASLGLRALSYQSQILPIPLEGKDLRVTGTIVSLVQKGEIAEYFVLQTDAASQALGVSKKLRLAWYQRQPSQSGNEPEGDVAADAAPLPNSLRAGQIWTMTVRLKRPHGNVNPHGFDYELWSWERGVGATGYVRDGKKDDKPQLLAYDWWRTPVQSLRQSVRDAVYTRVTDPRLAGIVAALAMGDQNAMDDQDWTIFRQTGVAHLMSISGLHITMFAWLAMALIGGLWRSLARQGASWSQAFCLRVPLPYAAWSGGIILALLYALLSGWGVPAQRTIFMLTIVMGLRFFALRWPKRVVWVLTAAIVLAIDPWAMLQAGFWLSFIAVALLFASDLDKAAPAPKLITMLREQLMISLALAPLTLLLFQQISLVGLLVNLVAIPWVSLLIAPLSLAGMVWHPLWDLAAWSSSGFMAFLAFFADLPLAVWQRPALPLWLGVLAILGAALAVFRWPVAVRVLFAGLALPAFFIHTPKPPLGEFELLVMDVGQGTALLLRTQNHSLLYDTGPKYLNHSDAGIRIVVPLLRALGENPDVVVLSHQDSDHAGGAQSVLSAYPQARIYAGIDLMPPCQAGQSWVWDGVRFAFLYPDPADTAQGKKSNPRSCVLEVRNQEKSVLLTGDIEAAQEQMLYNRQLLKPVDVLIVPHHGSKTSSTEAFLQALQPKLALIQAGYRNRYQHPAPEVLARYRALQIPILTTVDCGAYTWRSWGEGSGSASACQREKDQRYWFANIGFENIATRP